MEPLPLGDYSRLAGEFSLTTPVGRLTILGWPPWSASTSIFQPYPPI